MSDQGPNPGGLPDDRGGAGDRKPPARSVKRLPQHLRASAVASAKRQNLGGRPPGPKERRLPSMPLLKCLLKDET